MQAQISANLCISVILWAVSSKIDVVVLVLNKLLRLYKRNDISNSGKIILTSQLVDHFVLLVFLVEEMRLTIIVVSRPSQVINDLCR